MPKRVGDQHQQNAATANPFEQADAKEKKQHISPYTAQEIATLQSRLDKQLGPEYISSRPGAGNQKVHYLAAEKVINLANEIFGFNGWSSSIQNIQIDFVDEHPETRKISLGLSVIIRVTLRDGTYHEDVGYGNIENCKGKAAAFEKAKKEGTTDALKRALRTFGNVLGNCVYDKDYVTKVTKLKVGVGKWDEKNLHRHPDFAPKQGAEMKTVNQPSKVNDTSSGEKDDSFSDIADFDETEFDENDFGRPDEVVLPADPADTTRTLPPDSRHHGNPHMQRNIITPSRPPNGVPSGMKAPATRPNMPNHSVTPQPLPGNGPIPGRNEPQRAQGLEETSSNERELPSSPGFPSQHFSANTGAPAPRAPLFFSARAAGSVEGETQLLSGPAAHQQFNPHSDSPSIRKTAGVDHNRSVGLLRDTLLPQPEPPKKDNLEPQSEPVRRVGTPGFGQAGQLPGTKPLSTSAYRPPTRRGLDTNGNTAITGPPAGVDRVLAAAKRPPLSDVSNLQEQHSVTARTDDGADVKRQRITASESGIHPGNESGAIDGVG